MIHQLIDKGHLTKFATPVKLICGDALETLKSMPDNSVHLCVTDPPYFIDSMGDDWQRDKFADAEPTGSVGYLKSSMKFDPRQGQRFQTFMADIAVELARILKPGGFAISFSQARLYHRLAIAFEDAGFEIRDMAVWLYRSGQAKAFSQDHFIDRMKISEKQRAAIKASIGGRKTPQLKPCVEPMTIAQKTRDGTFVDNWLKHQVGLIDVRHSLDGMFPGNAFECSKPTRAERGQDNDHPTVKPTALIATLIKIFSAPGQTVIDPFMGSGSHGVAAVEAGRCFIGVERDPHYFDIAQERISSVNTR